MCYSGIPYGIVNYEKLRERRRGRYLHVAREQVPAASTGSRGAAAGAGMAKQCVCSPTIHPGSFRCRHHYSDYKWVAPPGTKSNHLGASVPKTL